MFGAEKHVAEQSEARVVCDSRTVWHDGHCYHAITFDGRTTYYQNGFEILWDKGQAVFALTPPLNESEGGK